MILAVALMACVLSMYSWQIRRQSGSFVVTGWLQVTFIWYFFLIVPVAHVAFNYLPFAIRPHDIPNIFTNLLLLNAVGLVFANLGFAVIKEVRLPVLDYDRRRLTIVSGAFIVMGVLAWVVTLNAGMLYVNTETLARDANSSITFYLLSGVVPTMFILVIVANFKGKHIDKSIIWALILILAILCVVFCGIRGSRSGIIIAFVTGMMWIHLMVRPFRWGELAALGAVGAILILAYGRYKYGGLGAVFGTDDKSLEYANSMLDPLRIFLLDLGRAEVQAVVFDNFNQGHFVPRYNGETYIRSLTLILPQSWEPSWPRPKTVVGGLALYHPNGSGQTEGLLSSRIYGLTGEAILNFGYLAIPVVFFLFGMVHSWLLAALDRMKGAAQIFVPLAIVLPMMILFVDMDNLVIFLIMYWSIPVLVVAVSLRRTGRSLISGSMGVT